MKTFPHKKWNPFLQLDYHSGLFLTGPIPVPGGAWHIGFGILAMPWIYLGTPKYNECKIFGDGMEIVARGHEPKYLIIPHLNLFPFVPATPNILIPLLILGSSNKCQFAVGSVRLTDGPVAVSIFKYVGINQACNDPCTAPTSLCFNWGSINIGFTWGDLVAGLLCFAFDSLKSYIEGAIFGALFKRFPVPKGLFKGQMKSLLGRLGLPKVFRGQGGRFASMSEKLVAEGVSTASKALYGEMFGGGNLGQATGFDNIDPVNGIANGAAAGADRVGAWIDGRSELFGD